MVGGHAVGGAVGGAGAGAVGADTFLQDQQPVIGGIQVLFWAGGAGAVRRC